MRVPKVRKNSFSPDYAPSRKENKKQNRKTGVQTNRCYTFNIYKIYLKVYICMKKETE